MSTQLRRRRTRRWRRLVPRPSDRTRRTWSTLLGVGLGLLIDVSPVGATALDRIWSAVLVGAAGYLASSAKRGPLLVASVVVLMGARTGPGLALGMLTLASAALSTRRLHRRATFARGAAGALAVAAALISSRELSPFFATVVLLGVALPVGVSGWRNTRDPAQKVVTWIARGVVAAGLLGAGLAGLGVLQSAGAVDGATTELRLGLAAARQGDPVQAEAHLTVAAARIDGALRDVDRWGLVGRAVPGVAQHVRALSAVLRDVRVAANQAAVTAQAANVDTLQVVAGRIDTDDIARLRNPLRRLTAALGEVVDEISDRRSSLLLPALSDRLDEVDREVRRAHREASIGASATELFPGLLGGDRPTRYLVLFTSPAEARGRFGFPGSFAEVLFEEGRLRLGEHGATSELLPPTGGDPVLADVSDQLRPYLQLGVAREMRSTTIPPDFPTVAAAAERIWVASGRPALDGVARFDPVSLAKLMGLTGPVDIRSVGHPLDETNLVSYVNFDQYVQFQNNQAPRREVLSDVAEETFERLQTANLPSPRVLADLFGPLVRDGHLQIVTLDETSAPFFGRVGLDGAFEAPAADSLMVATVNSAGNKIDAFLERSVHYTASVDDDGKVEGQVEIRLDNTAPGQGLPFYVNGSFTDPPLPRGTNRMRLLVYTGAEPVGVTIDGQELAVRTEFTAGRWLAEIPLEMGPQTGATVVVTVRGEVQPGRPYSLELLPGGGARPERVLAEVEVDGGGPLRFQQDLLGPVTLR